MSLRAIAARVTLAAWVLLAAGCGLERQRLIPFAPSNYVMFGRIERGGLPLAGQLVKLYDESETVLFDSLRSDPSGEYGFESAPSGGVMVKVSSLDTLDFGYVRYILTRGSDAERDSIPPMDLRAYGCRPLDPPPGAGVPAPDPSSPLTFRWAPMSLAGTIKYKVRLADAQDSTVWESVREVGTSADFNGIGTFGVYAATLVGPGAYTWRVKVRLPNGVQAATAPRTIVFTPNGAGAPQ